LLHRRLQVFFNTDLDRELSENKRLFGKALQNADVSFYKGDYKSTVAWAKIAANFAFSRHPGFYVDFTLEDLLIGVAQKLEPNPVDYSDLITKVNGKMRFLHVITESYGTGGHTAFISRWIENTNENSTHSLVSTATEKKSIAQNLKASIAKSGGSCFSLPELSDDLFEQALFLRRIAQATADVVVLFVHPFDPMPTLAFGVKGGPPVVFVNHADHAFWLNNRVSDAIVDYHSSGLDLSAQRRGRDDSKIMPIPLTKNSPKPQNQAARKELGLRDKDIMLLTVGRAEKFLSFGNYDFLKSTVKVLTQYPKAKLFAVGPENSRIWQCASQEVNGRIKACGALNRAVLEKFYEAADLYVGSFPCGSGTALLEAATHDLPAISLQIEELPHISGFDDVACLNQELNVSSIEEFGNLLGSMIDNCGFYRSKAWEMRENIESKHCAPGWNIYVDSVLHSLPSQHQIRNPADIKPKTEHYDRYVAYLDSQIMQNELPEHSFNRLIYAHGENLPRQDTLKTQASVFMCALPKIKSVKAAREYASNLRLFCQHLIK
jgi:hypothetical protein